LVSFQKRLLFWKEGVEIFDNIKIKTVKKISKLQVSCIILVFLFILIQGGIQVKKAYDYQNDPKNGFGYVE
jgi:hypothetical protein